MKFIVFTCLGGRVSEVRMNEQDLYENVNTVKVAHIIKRLEVNERIQLDTFIVMRVA